VEGSTDSVNNLRGGSSYSAAFLGRFQSANWGLHVTPARFVVLYGMGLVAACGVFVLYLLVPRGWRQAYCRTERKRYSKMQSLPPNMLKRRITGYSVSQQSTPSSKLSSYKSSSQSSSPNKSLSTIHSGQFRDSPQAQHTPYSSKPPLHPPPSHSVQSSQPRQPAQSQNMLLQGIHEARIAANKPIHRQPLNPPMWTPLSSNATTTFPTILPPRQDTLSTDSSFRKLLDQSYRLAFEPQARSQQPPEPVPQAIIPTPIYSTASEALASTGSHRTPADWRGPTPTHPGVSIQPERSIIDDTLQRLHHRGIRLMAHGVQSEPRRIWLRLKDNEADLRTSSSNETSTSSSSSPPSLTIIWQTEFPRPKSTDSHLSWMRGPEHPLQVSQILYLDVGKKTAALAKTGENVMACTCLSLLTRHGSLDLQANSRLERDAIVCSLSYILDQVHGSMHDWRALYEESLTLSDMTPSGVTMHTAQLLRSPRTAIEI
jgi:hypothetical protein